MSCMGPATYTPCINTVCTVGLNMSAFQPLDPGTKWQQDQCPCLKVLGSDVLDTGILTSVLTCQHIGSIHQGSQDLSNEVTDVSGLYGMPQPRRPEEPPSCQPLGPPDPDLLSAMYPPTYRPLITRFVLTG